jgi:predicted TIM-barrel fold metal-dependent hydrolase
MVATSVSKAAAIRAGLGHPIIDSDGHADPLGPDFRDYVREVGGSRMADSFESALAADPMRDQVGIRNPSVGGQWYQASLEQRRDVWLRRPSWWPFPTRSTLDRATAKLPKLMHERLDELGIDFTILYLNMMATDYLDDELRRVACRAGNMYYADIYRPYADRMRPVAIIPMYTPREAIEELEYAVNVLGFKAIQIAAYVRRPIPKIQRDYPGFDFYHQAYRIDTYGIDSEHDYDPFWAKCVELRVAPTAHSTGMGWTGRRSPSNYMYNHIGHFGDVGEALMKSLFLGGVTRRFPTLHVAALECGVGWGCDLYASLIARWEKRNGRAVRENLDPALLDQERMLDFILQYGDESVKGRLEQARAALAFGATEPGPEILDDFAACGIERAEDIRDLFVPNFFFGCEADDPMNAWAFNAKVNPFGARLNAVFSSDITHWDVPDLTEVVADAYELVERGLLTEADFRDFVFTNPVKLHGGMNPDFFKGTAVESAVADCLRQLKGTPAPVKR